MQFGLFDANEVQMQKEKDDNKRNDNKKNALHCLDCFVNSCHDETTGATGAAPEEIRQQLPSNAVNFLKATALDPTLPAHMRSKAERLLGEGGCSLLDRTFLSFHAEDKRDADRADFAILREETTSKGSSSPDDEFASTVAASSLTMNTKESTSSSTSEQLTSAAPDYSPAWRDAIFSGAEVDERADAHDPLKMTGALLQMHTRWERARAAAGKKRDFTDIKQQLKGLSEAIVVDARHGHQQLKKKNWDEQLADLRGKTRAILFERGKSVMEGEGGVTVLSEQKLDEYVSLKAQSFGVLHRAYEDSAAKTSGPQAGKLGEGENGEGAVAGEAGPAVGAGEKKKKRSRANKKRKGKTKTAGGKKASSTEDTSKMNEATLQANHDSRADDEDAVLRSIDAKLQQESRIKGYLQDSALFTASFFIMPEDDHSPDRVVDAHQLLLLTGYDMSLCERAWPECIDLDNDPFYTLFVLMYAQPPGPRTDAVWGRYLQEMQDGKQTSQRSYYASGQKDHFLRSTVLDPGTVCSIYAWRNLLTGPHRLAATSAICRDIATCLRLRTSSVFFCEFLALLLAVDEQRNEENPPPLSSRTPSDAADDLRRSLWGRKVMTESDAQTLRALELDSTPARIFVIRAIKSKDILFYVLPEMDSSRASYRTHFITCSLHAMRLIALQLRTFGDPDYGRTPDNEPAPILEGCGGKKALETKEAQALYAEVQRRAQQDSEWYIPEYDLILYSQDSRMVFRVDEGVYATLGPNLKLSAELQEEFSNALKKGLASREKKANGVKFIGGIAELKINGDDRLWTDTRYFECKQTAEKQRKSFAGCGAAASSSASSTGQNKPKILLVFDHDDNHIGVKRVAEQSREMRDVECPPAPKRQMLASINEKRAAMETCFNRVKAYPTFVGEALGLREDQKTFEDACCHQ
ncbi:unnamed protein product [Amoebophrya sp. A120]|nr:unnamed protein product [Amoebophrya sp. A120]|eukprot:GSA120T00016968001.1